MKIFRKTDRPLTQAEITDWLRELRGNPHVPASGFDVTAVFRAKVGQDDNYYFAGVNVENPHHRLSTHGEEGAISALTTGLGKQAEIVEGWVMGAPAHLKVGDDHALANNQVTCCGKCRQQIAGFAGGEVPLHSITLNGAHEQMTVDESIPKVFTFRQFAPELQRDTNANTDEQAPTGNDVENRLMQQGKTLSDQEIFAWLNELNAVDFASKTSQAVVARLKNGAYVAGVKVEEAAFVSIDPSQSAMAIANAEFGKPEVMEVWSLSKGRDGAEIPAEAFSPLTLSGVQVLGQFATNNSMPIHLFNGKGEQMSYKLHDSARYLPTFERPTIIAPNIAVSR